MAGVIRSTHALRLGLRQISGFAERDAQIVEAARRESEFRSLRDFWLRTGLPLASLRRLAQADAFGSLGLDRRSALWHLRALRRVPDKDDLPLFARVTLTDREPDPTLSLMAPGEQVIADYRYLNLSLKAHPLSFLRERLAREKILRAEELPRLPSGRRVAVAGLVLVRQHPGSAKSIFMTIEDETGIANAIVWPKVFEEFRGIVMGARLVVVHGRLQSESGVIHIIAERIEDRTPLLRTLLEAENARPLPPHTFAAGDAGAAMPKGRNFH
jgi:error-prone DNA polymerase